MIILGLDTGTKTGWAAFDSTAGRVTESGVQDFSKRRGESNGLVFLRFRNWLGELVAYVHPDLLAYEQVHHRGGAATELGVSMTTRVQEVAAEYDIECASVHTGTLKKWAVGHGKASKDQMIRQARRFIGRDPLDDNEADAVLIAHWAAEQYG